MFWPEPTACSSAVTPSLSAMPGSAPASSRMRTISWYGAEPSPRMTASSRAVQPRSLTWLTSMSGLHHAPDVVDVAAFAGRDHRDSAEAVADRQVGVGRQQGLQHRHAAGDAGDQPRGVVAVVERIGVGAQRDEQPGDGDPVVRRGEQQGGPLAGVAGLEVGACRAVRARRRRRRRRRGGEQALLGGAVGPPGRSARLRSQQVGDLVWPSAERAGPAVSPSRSAAIRESAPAATRTRTVSTYRALPLPSMTASCRAVQPRLLTWSTVDAGPDQPADDGRVPRSAARISAVPL